MPAPFAVKNRDGSDSVRTQGENVFFALRLAEVQASADRTEDALATARRALVINPSSMELLHWIFLYANSHEEKEIAFEMTERALLLQPESQQWVKRFEKTGSR